MDEQCAMFAPNIYDTNMRTAGAVKRIGGQLPYVQPSTYSKLKKFVEEIAIPFLFPENDFKLMTFDEYIADKDYTLDKKACWKRYHQEHMETLGRCEPREHDVQTHTKLEFYSEPKCYRGIYARSDRFKASYGPLIASIERVVYKLKYFIKKIPVVSRPKFINDLFEGMSVWSNDHTAFESSNNPDMMDSVLRPIYLHISRLPDLVYDYMNALTARQRIKCKDFLLRVNGRRMSGEMDTSLGNALVNLICIMYVLYSKGMSLEEMKIIIEGDDSLFCTGDKDVTADDFKALGFSPKLESFDDPSDASFCGLIYDPRDLVNITDPIKVLLKLGWGDGKYIDASDRTKAELYRSKLLCGMVQYYQCPVIYPYLYHEFHRIGPGKTRSLGMWYDEILKQVKTIDVYQPPRVSMYSRLKMEKMFGVSTSQQLNFENSIPMMKSLNLSSFFNVPLRFEDNHRRHVLSVVKTSKMTYRQCARMMYPVAESRQWFAIV